MKLFIILLLESVYLVSSLDPSYPSAGDIRIGSQSICPSYVCQGTTIKTGCITYSGSQILLEGCLSDWYCEWDSSPSSTEPYQYGKCQLRQRHYKFRKNVNDFCYEDSDCKSTYCVSNKCSVKVSGATCSNSLECGKGMFCEPNSDTCQFWLADGQKCTQNPYLCKPSSGCVSVNGQEQVCTQFFSVNTESITAVYGTTFSSNKEDFCTSGSITSTGGCIETPHTLQGGYPKKCIQQSDCSASGDANQQNQCVCLPNTEGVKYCLPFSGDIQDVQKRIKERMTRDFSDCYNYEIYNGENECGAYDLNKDRDWAPQIKSGTWGSCFDSINLQVADRPMTLNGQCPVLQCNPSNNEDGDCIHYAQSSHTFYLQSCPANYICGTNEHGDYSLSTQDVICKYGRHRDRLAHKGEYCWVDSDCFSGICENNKLCGAIQLGAACYYHNECDRGLLCAYESSQFKYICQSWIDLDGTCTRETYGLCRPGLKCLANSAGQEQGTCVSYYSLSTGSTAYIMSATGSYQSGFDELCVSGAWDSFNKVCYGQSHKLYTFPTTCTDNSDCKSVNSNEDVSYYTECICFPNTQGSKYCKAYNANIDSDYFNYLSNYYNQNLKNCFYYEIGKNYGGVCGAGERYIDVWGQSIPGDYFPSCGKNVLYDEHRYQESSADDLIYLYVFSEKIFSYISALFLILLLIQ